MNGRSDESLNSSGDLTSSTRQQYSSQPTQVYYGDESDEGLVKIFFDLLVFINTNYFVYRIVCHRLIHLVHHMIVMIQMVNNLFFYFINFIVNLFSISTTTSGKISTSMYLKVFNNKLYFSII
jgi:hypothetical protein